jgi:homospermidine synthase
MKIFMAGCGAVGQCVLPILIKELPIEPSAITVMDFVDNRHRIQDPLALGVVYVQDKITQQNYKQ